VPALNSQLNAVDQRLVTILDAMLVGVVIIDPWNHTIAYANDESASMMGYHATDLLGHICHNFICPIAVGNCPISDLKQEIDRSERCVLNREGQRLVLRKYSYFLK
jgi:PAS domain-containing protein